MLLKRLQKGDTIGIINPSSSNYGDLNPHPLLVKLYYSHPTLSQRIDNIKANMIK